MPINLELNMEQLVLAPATTFPGSFASDLRRDYQKYAESRAWRSVLHSYFTDGWQDISIWKSAFIEFVGSTAMCYLSGMIHTTIGSFDTKAGAAYAGVTNLILISLFIFAMAPSSGGHVNPLITFTTVTTGLTGFSRGVLYVIAQTIGAALAGCLIRGSFGRDLTKLYQGGGCQFDPSLINVGQAFLIEAVLSFVLVFLAFGVGLDPRCGAMFGPVVGPLLVGTSLGLASFSSIGLANGYPGVGMNPARCFAFSVARRDFHDQWIWWVGPLTGALVQTAVYHIAPPYHRQLALERASSKSEGLQSSHGKV
ncbi:aquaporin-like protein [Acephala macrosclerotiorum]|nr:aquaporin-like protein [Acephala macrosclerotiorum]